MGKIPVSALIADFQTMLSQRWAYGADTKRGQVDCSGAFVWAYKQYNHDIYHGSNRIARVEVEELIPINMATIVPGMAAFKRRAPGENGYALPSGYQPGGDHYNGDLNDYYHVGLVDEDTARVLNAQSAATGFVASPIDKGWSHVGYLKQVDYERASPVSPVAPASPPTAEQPATAFTTAPSGGTVNLRAAASLSAKLIDRIPIGQAVTLRGPESGGWYPVRWGKKEGYVKADYLRGGDPGDWAVTLSGLTQPQAREIAARYPMNSPSVFQTHG